MVLTHQQLIEIAMPYVIGLYNQYDTSKLHFHDLQHTMNVVQHVSEIGAQEGISEEEKTVLELAALFHDTGHLNGGIEEHEVRSVTLLKTFLNQNGFDDPGFTERVEACILATSMPHHPSNKLEEIICDADVYHFGTDEFRETNKKIKKELIERGYKQYTRKWLQHSYQLLNDEQFYTDYCRQHLTEGRQKNIDYIKAKLVKKGEVPGAVAPPEQPSKKELQQASEEAKEMAKQDQRLITRGVQTVMRIASSNHIELSRMADGKANILISVNAIIISVILSVLINRLDVDTYLTIPTIIFLTSSVVVIVIAILATRPKLTEGTIKHDDVINRKTNLLFFGNFYRSTLQDYSWAMNFLLQDKEYLHGTQIMDIYYLGKVLGRKYFFLRVAYTIFMIGIIVSALAFMLAVLLNTPKGHITVIDGSAKPF